MRLTFIALTILMVLLLNTVFMTLFIWLVSALITFAFGCMSLTFLQALVLGLIFALCGKPIKVSYK